MHQLSDLGNRLRKIQAQRLPWAARQGLSAFRIFEHDIPEWPLIIDWYDGEAVVWDRGALSSGATAEGREALIAEVAAALRIPADRVHLKQRQSRAPGGDDQYTRLDRQGRQRRVREADAVYLVNLTDYLDTGLFLDHRWLRRKVRQDLKPGVRFLNLFCYTASVSVAAALAGARTTNLDLSAAYLEWARANFEANGLAPGDHDFLRADVTAWLAEGGAGEPGWDCIYLDPPTFSNSKAMRGTLDIQRDHLRLIRQAMARLMPGGTLWFSTNFTRFSLDPAVGRDFQVEDVTEASLDADFRNRRIHHCFRVTAR